MNNETNAETTQASSSTWAEYAATAFAGGNGSESAPYLIANAPQLAFMAKVFNDDSGQYISTYNRKHYRLTNSIDLESREWVPIGDHPFGRKCNTCFYFDGGGNTVSGLLISKPMESFKGLFGFADGDSVIRNLNIAGANVTGFQNVGGIIGRMRGSIENCTVSGQISGKREVGGIAGSLNYGSVFNCSNSGIVLCERHGGGITGSLFGYARNCGNTGEISGNEFIGGLVGTARLEGFIEAGENSGIVTGKVCVGGIVGRAKESFLLTLCMNHSTIQGENYVGGIAGQAELITDSCNEGGVRGTKILGGVCGTAQEIAHCQNTGDIEGKNAVIGGVVGICHRVMDSFNLAGVRGNGPMGGIVGRCEGDLVKNCHNAGNISGTGILGGVVGLTTRNSYVISDCYNAGILSETWASGPILGRHDRSYKGGAMIDTSVYLKGSVEGNE